MQRNDSRKKTTNQNSLIPIDGKPQYTCNQPKYKTLEVEYQSHSSQEITIGGTKESSVNTPAAQANSNLKMPRKNSRKKTKPQNRSIPVDSKLQNKCSSSKITNLEFDSTTHSSPELTTDGTKQCSVNTPVAQGDTLHIIEQAAQSGSPKEMLECFNQLIHTENKVNQESLDQGLLLSCRYGREFLVQILIFHGANIETRDEDGNTPLLICAEKGFTDIALLLVDKGADINSYNKDGDTALLLSIKTSGSSHLIKTLLEKNYLNVRHKNKHKHDALMKTIEVLNFPFFKKLLAHLSNTGRYTLKYYAKSEPSFTEIVDSLGLSSFLSILIQYSDIDKSILKTAVLIKDIYTIKLLLYSQVVDFRSNHREVNISVLPEFLNFIQHSGQEITKQDLNIIKTLLKAGAPLNSDYRGNEHPLVTAVKLGCYDLVEMLCQHTHENFCCYRQYTPLALAAQMGRCDIMNLLIKYGKGELDKSLALKSSVKHEQIESAKLLVEIGATIHCGEALDDIIINNRVKSFLFLKEHFKYDVISAIKNKGTQFLNLAASKGHKEIIKLLVEEGADLNASYNYKTPLMSAVDPSTMELLIKSGADVNAKVEKYSASFTIFDCILNEHKEGKMRVKLVNMVKVLINHGFKVNVQDKKGNTPLMKASQKSNMEKVLRSLLQAGADVNNQNNDGESALHLAVCCKSILNAKVLLESKSDIDLKTKDGKTPLFYAILERYLNMIILLVENNANVNCENNIGNTPLLFLCSDYVNDVDVIKMLINYGACVNHHNNKGYTPLMVAAKKQSFDILKILCESGAEINSVNEKEKETALSILLDMPYNRNIVLYLIAKGADCSCVSPAIIHQLIVKKEFSSLKHIIALGLGPAEITPESFDPGAYDNTSKPKLASPFVVSLSKGYVKTARFLNDIWFLTLSDVSNNAFYKQFRSLLVENELIERLEFLDEYLYQPMSLQKLSFVVVSSAVGSDAGRKERVAKLQIPKMLQDKLVFLNATKLEAELEEDRISTSDGLVTDQVLNAGVHRRRHFYSDNQDYYSSDDNGYDNTDYDSDY
ncbi:putative ankyrin repeat protein RF_0381 [Physella acuta]|uniref:putative ankyrin repeat protein RF_0381 n=1 Tax=Physella acuta TaxID=109671 RepID=UPI0027DCDF8C|nr:putative ankyrin repeat protein RF_0381 [Physella acuta]